MTGAYDQKPMKSSLMEIGRDQERQEVPIGFKRKKSPIASDRRNHKESQSKTFDKGRQEVIFSSNRYNLCEQKMDNH